jgi:hypothetical protein
MKKVFITLSILVSAILVNAQKVEVGADRTVNLAKYKTYSWTNPPTASNPLIGQAIMDAVDRAMTLKGLTKVAANAEINLVVFAATESDLHISYPSWHPGMNSIATGIVGGSQQWPVTKGTMVVDMVDANTKNSIWRGQATDTLDHGPTGNLQKDAKSVEKKIKKAVDKMFKKFPVAN